jgi:tetratricopeptide (TPR) repeat protein
MSIEKPSTGAGLFSAAGAALLAMLAYGNAVGGQFVYDDHFQVLRNPTLASLSNLPAFFGQSVWQFMSASPDQPLGLYYRPLFNAALLLEYQVFGTRVFGWHAVSISLHALTTLLVYALGRAWRLSVAAAALGAALFAVHPVHCESVAWISGLPDLLAAVGLLGTAIVYERGCRSGRPLAWIAAVALLAVALLSKEVAAAFPLFILGREWLEDEAPARRPRVRAWLRAVPFAALVGVFLAARYAVLGRLSGTDASARAVTGIDMLLTMPSVLATYLRLLVAPYGLGPTYDVTFVTEPWSDRFLVPLAVVVPAVAAAGALLAAAPLTARPLLWLGAFLWPVLNLRAFNHYESLVHDRYLYIPSAGFCLLLGLGAAALRQRGGLARAASTIGAVMLVGGWLLLTVAQNRVWRDDVALSDHVLRMHPDSAYFHNYRGATLFERGDLVGAEASYRIALQLRPGYGDAYSNLADVQLRAGRWNDAVALYQQALNSGAPYVKIYLNLGLAHARAGDLAAAGAAYAEAARRAPALVEAHLGRGWVREQLGDPVGAEAAYRAALALRPSSTEARARLARLLERQGRMDAAPPSADKEL